MRKSIFAKYFSITACVLLACFVVLGGILLKFTKNQWIDDKQQLLSANVKTIAEYTNSSLTAGENSQTLRNWVQLISNIISADIYITDSEGQIILCGDENMAECRHSGKKLDSGIIKKAVSGEASFTNNMSGLYKKDCYTVSSPIYYKSSVIGAVFASVPVSGSSLAVSKMFNVMLICSILILLAAFVIIYLLSLQTTKPLRQMAAAAKQMENGEFVQIPEPKRKDEIAMLVEAFNRMSQSLSQLEGMRRSFISSVSHELKTPMTTISGFVDGMLDGTIKKEDYPKYLQIVSDETKRLSRLVNSMLQLSRLENDSVQLNYSSFNVSDLLVRILLSFENKIDEKKLDIRGLEDTQKTMLHADRDLIYQVLYNLVENAIKFTPNEGYIYVRIEEDKIGTVKISIENSGEGLNSMELSRVFERFYKTDRSRSNDKTGMGFGLYIVKMIVGLHGGQINAESVLNEYTRFTVTLPNEAQIPADIVPDTSKSDKRFRMSHDKKENGANGDISENTNEINSTNGEINNQSKGDSDNERI